MLKKKLTQLELEAIETLTSLTLREKTVLETRYLGNYSLREAGKLLRLSDERIREIENSAIKKIKKYVNRKSKK